MLAPNLEERCMDYCRAIKNALTFRELLQELISFDIPRDEIDGQPTKNLLIHLCQELMHSVTEMENHGPVLVSRFVSF